MSVSRRYFVSLMSAAGVATLATPNRTKAGAEAVFMHGVASGDPLADRVIIWTRITPPKRTSRVDVNWFVSLDPAGRVPVASGAVRTRRTYDYTVKVDVTGLQPDTTYYYHFESQGDASPIGRTKTLPLIGADRLRFAVASCSNYPFGFFNGYALIAAREDLDFVVHLGDYIYEYANGTYGDGTALDRVPIPDAEIVTLNDYRQRYAQYRSDPQLQEAHRQHPFICTWDDHESTNNAWRDGAENHNPELGEGDWQTRRSIAERVYHEWMPIRGSGDQSSIYRRFRYGDLAELVMLDTRLLGRDEQLANPLDSEALADPRRQLLGVEQERWLQKVLALTLRDRVQWRVLGQQVMFGHLFGPAPDGLSLVPLNTDQWDGYQAARQRIFDYVGRFGIDNLVVLTGDIHSSWASELAPNPFDPSGYDPVDGAGSMGVEFVTPGITSPGITDQAQAIALGGQLRAVNQHIKYVDLFHRGYMLVDIDPFRAQAEWYHLDSIVDPVPSETLGAVAQSAAGSNGLSTLTTPAAPKRDAAPAAPVGLDAVRRLFI